MKNFLVEGDPLHAFRVLSGIRPSRLSLEEAQTGVTEHERRLTEAVGGYSVQKTSDAELYFLWKTTAKNGNPQGVLVRRYLGKRNPEKPKKDSVPQDLLSRLWKSIAEKDLPPEIKTRFADAG